MWFVFWLLILFLLFSGSGYYGYRRSYYGRSSAFSWIGLLIVIFLIMALWGGPHWGYYNSYWGAPSARAPVTSQTAPGSRTESPRR